MGLNAAKRWCGVCRKVLGPSTLLLDPEAGALVSTLDAGINLSHGNLDPGELGNQDEQGGGNWHTMCARCSPRGLLLAMHGASLKGRECQQMAIESFLCQEPVSGAIIALDGSKAVTFLSSVPSCGTICIKQQYRNAGPKQTRSRRLDAYCFLLAKHGLL